MLVPKKRLLQTVKARRREAHGLAGARPPPERRVGRRQAQVQLGLALPSQRAVPLPHEARDVAVGLRRLDQVAAVQSTISFVVVEGAFELVLRLSSIGDERRELLATRREIIR